MTRRRGTIFTFIFLFALRSWGVSLPGAIGGSVIDDSGRPVSGARVLINLAPPAGAARFTSPPVETGALVTVVTADANGIFQVPVLPAGQYIACAESAAPGLLDPCHWSASAPTFTVDAAKGIAPLVVTMTRGAIIPIHVSDPLTLLQPMTPSSASMDLQVHVVTNKGLHLNAPVQASSAVGRDYAATVPFGAAITLRVMASPNLKVNDQSGNPIDAAGTSVMPVSGASPVAVEYVVAGTK